MKLLAKWFRLLVFSNLWISLSAGALAHVTYKVFNLSEDIGIVLFAISATFISYNFQRIVRLGEVDDENLQQQNWLITNRITIYVFLFIASVLSLLFLWPYLSLHLFELLGGLGLLSFFYALPLKGFSGLRDLPFVKIILIAISWAGLGAILPFVVHHSFFIVNWNFVGQVFLFFIAITIPFDIRDMKFDTQIKTIPGVIGWKNAKLLSLLLMGVIIIWNLMTFNYLFLTITYILTLILLIPVNSKSQELYYSGVLDGTIFLFLVNYLLLGTIHTF